MLNQPWEDKKIEESDWNPLKNMADMQGKFLYDFARPSVTADIVVTSKSTFGTYYLLLIKRGNEPFKDTWALPGGFLDMDETLKDCATRELKEETGIDITEESLDLKTVGIYDRVNRDPRGRVISHVFITYIEKLYFNLQAGDDAKEVKWFNMKQLPELAFDHEEIIAKVKRDLEGTYS